MDIWIRFLSSPLQTGTTRPCQHHSLGACVWFHYIQQVANGKRLGACTLWAMYLAGQERTPRGQKRSRRASSCWKPLRGSFWVRGTLQSLRSISTLSSIKSHTPNSSKFFFPNILSSVNVDNHQLHSVRWLYQQKTSLEITSPGGDAEVPFNFFHSETPRNTPIRFQPP